AGEKENVPRAACRAALAQVLREKRALLDTKHIAGLVARFCQIQDRYTEQPLETRDDAAPKERDWIVEPRISFGKDLERHERRRFFQRRGCALRPRAPSAALFHYLHRGGVFANAARVLLTPLLFEVFAFGPHIGRRGRRHGGFASARVLASASVTGPVSTAVIVVRVLARVLVRVFVVRRRFAGAIVPLPRPPEAARPIHVMSPNTIRRRER